jgi:hypothetical protein
MLWEARLVDQRIEQLLKDAREALRIDKERVELFEMLVRTPGWIAYVSILEAKLQMLADQVLAPAGSVDALIGLEYIKGAMSGLVMARDIPGATIAAKDQLRAESAMELDDDESV